MRLMIVLTYREVEINDSSAFQTVLTDFSRERLADRIKLTRFDRDQTSAMLSTLLHPLGAIEDSLVDAIYRETEGNPFFIEEVTKALIENGKLCYEGVCWVADEAVKIEIPQSVRLTVQARLARLPDETQEVLRLAAVLGRDFDFEILKQASDLDEDDLIVALENAEQAQIINELLPAPGTSFAFRLPMP
jgi:predicted ATPase